MQSYKEGEENISFVEWDILDILFYNIKLSILL